MSNTEYFMVKEGNRRRLPQELLWGRRVETVELSTHPYIFFVVRHGEPLEYGRTNAELNDNGVNQIRAFARMVATESLRTPRIQTIIDIRHSNRPRTKQSAFVFREEMIRLKDEEMPELTNTLLLHPRSEQLLSPRHTIENFIDNPEIGKEKAYEEWVSTPSEELQKSGMKTPKQVAGRVLVLFNRMRNEPHVRLRNTRVIGAAFTHETQCGALLDQLNESGRLPLETIINIPYAAVLQITDDGRERCFEYGGTVFSATEHR